MKEDIERDEIEVDILCVGAGPASLATALRLLKKTGAETGKKPPSVMILDKAGEVAQHVLSGAVLDPGSLRELLSDEEYAALPVFSTVRRERFAYLTGQRAWMLPLTPPPMKAWGCPIVSLAEVTRYLASLCEKAGAEIYTEMSVVDYLEENGRVTGVRLGDKGVDKNGNPKSNFEPGANVRAKFVVLGEGAQGIVTQKLIQNRGLAQGAEPQAYALGIKEVFEIPPAPDRAGEILHTFGYPLGYDTYGGGFAYCLDATHVAIGLVVALDYRRPEINPHEIFRAYKAHPAINPLLTAGKPVEYGAKILPEGGVAALPRLITDGAFIVGDAGGLLDAVRLKGAHLAIESGIAAGDALAAAWTSGDWSPAVLQQYPDQLRASKAWKTWNRYRNVRAWFDWGLLPGMAAVGAAYLTFGLLPPRKAKREDHLMHPAGKHAPKDLPTLRRKVEKEHLPDLMTDLYLSGTEHDEDQPCHLVIQDPLLCQDCIALYNAPCTRFCPAQVYELPEGTQTITIQPSNCLHCKTCVVKCARQTIEWRFPEAGGGPKYKKM